MFKTIKISPDCHKILKKYSKQQGRTMKWILDNFIKTQCQDKKHGVKLKIGDVESDKLKVG